MHARSALLALVASATYAVALSTSCTTEVTVLALGGLGTCLQLTSLLSVISASGSITSSLNTYLSTLCSSSTTTCSNSTLTSAISSITSSCSTDLSSSDSSATEIKGLLILLNYYPQVIAAGCSKNSTTGDYCLIDALDTVQTATGTNVTLSTLTSALSGDTSSLETAVTSGAFCTECNSGIYYEVLQANSSISSSTLGSDLTSKCGSSFGTTAPNSTVTVASTSSSSAAATSSTSSSAGYANASPFGGIMSTAFVAGSMIGAVALGAIAVL